MTRSMKEAFSLAVSAIIAAAILCAPAPAWANNGNGKGNGGGGRDDRGNGGDRGNSGDRSNRGGNGNGRENAPGQIGNSQAGGGPVTSVAALVPNGQLSRPLASYRGAVLVARDAISVQNAAAVEYQTLIGLSQREIAQLYPNGGYNAALEQARVRYDQTTTRAHSAQAAVDAALRDVTGGRSLSDETRTELHRRLGL